MVGGNLKRLRLEKGYSLEKIVCPSYLSLNTIIHIEPSTANKNPIIDTFIKVAQVLNVSIVCY